MKIGIEIRVDVTQIPKERIYVGKKGKYATFTSFVNLEEEDQYGNHGFVTMAKTKEEGRDTRLPIIGNTRIFYKDEEADQRTGSPEPSQPVGDMDSEIPF